MEVGLDDEKASLLLLGSRGGRGRAKQGCVWRHKVVGSLLLAMVYYPYLVQVPKE
jgi:hypothetical protein